MKAGWCFIVVLLSLAALALPACQAADTPSPAVSQDRETPTLAVSGNRNTSTPAVSEVRETPTPAVSGDSGTPDDAPDKLSAYVQLLSVIPDTPEIRSGVFLNDYALVRALFEGLLPGPGDDDREVKSLLQDKGNHFADFHETVAGINTFGTQSFLGPLGKYDQFAINAHEYLALDLRFVEQTAWTWSPEGFGHLDVAKGGFDPAATERALQSCDDCPAPAVQDRGGFRFYSWGGDNEVGVAPRFSPPVFDHLGRGGQLAVSEEFVFRTFTTPGMEALIDAHSNAAGSLADAEEFVLLAQGLSQVRPHSVLLSGETFFLDRLVEMRLGAGATEDGRRELASAMSAPQALRPYEAYAMGSGLDENGNYAALVLAHSESEYAEENVEILRRRIEEGTSSAEQPWSEQVESAEISAEGRLLLARLRGQIAGSWINIVQFRENLLIHE